MPGVFPISSWEGHSDPAQPVDNDCQFGFCTLWRTKTELMMGGKAARRAPTLAEAPAPSVAMRWERAFRAAGTPGTTGVTPDPEGMTTGGHDGIRNAGS